MLDPEEATVIASQRPDTTFEWKDVTTPADAVFQALGAASMCWEHPLNGGIFNSDRAVLIGERLLAKLCEFGLRIDTEDED